MVSQKNKSVGDYHCGKCNKDVTDETSAMGCEDCDTWFHITCINMSSELYELIMLHEQNSKGLKWFCQSCFKPRPATRDVGIDTRDRLTKVNDQRIPCSTNSEQSTSASVAGSIDVQFNGDQSSNASSNFDESDDQSSSNQALKKSANEVAEARVFRKAICRKFRIGTCPHGISGKRIHNGTSCAYEHPKICTRFVNYGPHRYGCRLGRNCKFFHPIICNDSYQKLCCFNENCSRWHLKGTIFQSQNLYPHNADTQNNYCQPNSNMQQQKQFSRPNVMGNTVLTDGRNYAEKSSHALPIASVPVQQSNCNSNQVAATNLPDYNVISGNMLENHPALVSMKKNMELMNFSIKESIAEICQRVNDLQNFLLPGQVQRPQNQPNVIAVPPSAVVPATLPMPVNQPQAVF